MLSHPPTRIDFAALLDFFPSKTLPFAEVDLAQSSTWSAFDSECAGDGLCCGLRPTQVACVDGTNVFRAKSVDQFGSLFMAACIQIWVGVAAKCSGHVCLRMTNEEYIAHAIHTPQK